MKHKIKYKRKREKRTKTALFKNLAGSVKGSKAKKKLKKESISNGVHKTKIRIIGIGGGGGSIVSEIMSRIKKADFVVANTDARALRTIKGAKQFQFGKDLTNGLGTGMNVELGEAAAQNEKEKIKKLFDGQDICILIACLGGGTGCGATPVFAKISKSLNCLTYGIFTLPFKFEGEKKMEIAKEALLKIRPHLNIYSVIPNERIFQIINKDTPLRDALSAINKQLAENLEGLIEMIYLPGLINIDFADLKTILSGRGRLVYLKMVRIKDLKEEAAKKLISSQLYPYTIQGARGILYNILGGKNLRLSDVSKISKIISASLNKNAKIIFGINQRPKKQENIDLTILAAGCNIKDKLLKPIRPLLLTKNKLSGPIKQVRQSEKNNNGGDGHINRILVKPKEKEVSPVSPIRQKKKKVFMLTGQTSSKRRKYLKARKGKKKIFVSLLKSPVNEQGTKLLESQPGKDKKNKKSKLKLASKRKSKMSQVKMLLNNSQQQANKTTEQKLLTVQNKNVLNGLSGSMDKKIRRNALQVKKVVEEEEKKLLEKEKAWETPAIFRKKNNQLT